jgi:hypothetical protein
MVSPGWTALALAAPPAKRIGVMAVSAARVTRRLGTEPARCTRPNSGRHSCQNGQEEHPLLDGFHAAPRAVAFDAFAQFAQVS